jgi:uncharacterized membrane protein
MNDILNTGNHFYQIIIHRITKNEKNMNVKRIFGALLTLLGIGGLIYAAAVFASTTGGTRDVKSLIIFGILGFVFFISGIGLVKTTKDES